MRDRSLESIVEIRAQKTADFEMLMPWRVRNILLVSSLYDSYTFQEDGRLTESLFSEYLQLNLRYAPSVHRVSSAADALDLLRNKKFDLIISMLKIGDININHFCCEMRLIDPQISLVLLANNPRELKSTHLTTQLSGANRVFVWSGDVKLFLAIIKSIEDRRNVMHDSTAMGVPCILLIEDNVRFYSLYLPMLYTELMEHSQALMSDGLNMRKKILRMRSRPKILLATTYEEGKELFDLYKDHLIGVIVDASFPYGGKIEKKAGLDFAKMVKKQIPDRPILMQSSDGANESAIRQIGGEFINKHSKTLLHDLQYFMRTHLGFADFIFKKPDGTVVCTAKDLRSLQYAIEKIPIESILFHARRNDFSIWLMNRTEFDLSKKLRPLKITDFEDKEEIRNHLYSKIKQHRKSCAAGVVADFSSFTFEGTTGFVRIGSGSLGGKGRGLAFINALLDKYKINDKFPDVEIFVPPTAVIAVDIFDEFLEKNNLANYDLDDLSDKQITERFLKAALSKEVISSLRTFLTRVNYPLAIRSSSLLEDGSHQPFAGIYDTCMIPNKNEDLEIRLKQLCRAIKRVYASTFFANARAYLNSTDSRLEEEKMAVVIQQIVARQHEHYLYPSVAGVARSYNYYPMDDMKSEDGIVCAVLGLGTTVVDGGRCVRFSPNHPHKIYQFYSPKETIKTTQNEFVALDLNAFENKMPTFENSSAGLVNLDLEKAEQHGTLYAVGSVYDPNADAVYDGISRSGQRLVTLSGILKNGAYPFAEILKYILEIGTVAFSRPVEIEFAANIRPTHKDKHQFGFLQIRPVVVDQDSLQIDLEEIDSKNTICISHKSLGNGVIDNIYDILYVPKDSFDRSRTVEIASEIGKLNIALQGHDKPFLLVGPGRWGSADRWLGVPVAWNQISGAACIIETDLHDIKIVPSQGTHFFQNMTSLGIPYFTVNFDDKDGKLDLDWLDKQPPQNEAVFVKHLRFKEPLKVVVNGKQKMGIVLKPEK